MCGSMWRPSPAVCTHLSSSCPMSVWLFLMHNIIAYGFCEAFFVACSGCSTPPHRFYFCVVGLIWNLRNAVIYMYLCFKNQLKLQLNIYVDEHTHTHAHTTREACWFGAAALDCFFFLCRRLLCCNFCSLKVTNLSIFFAHYLLLTLDVGDHS